MDPATHPHLSTAVGDRPGREFWREALLAGGVTMIPRWTAHPERGVGEIEVEISETRTSLHELAGSLKSTPSAVLLAVHARVLAALTGEREVCIGYAPDAGSPLPCRVSLEGKTWRELLLECARVQSELLDHRHFPVEELRRELGLAALPFETVLDLNEGHEERGGALAEGTVVRLAVLDDPAGLRLRYRTDVLDADAAARIAGYHITALAQLAADPDSPWSLQSLLAPAEERRQAEEFAGTIKPLPDRRAHELFEEQARAHPDAVAAKLGDDELTYRELNGRANGLARALLAHGLTRESVVAVVTERNLGWLTAVLAILKSGGAYLPIEPHFPADRIARMVSRAGCRLVLTESPSAATLDLALATLPGTPRLLLDAALREGHATGDLGVAVAPDQLTYVYFTSGSTGEPKGVMCEHAGMVNHLLGKIEDLAIGAGEVVAQTAPQCFDISLWQLLSALMVGGCTLLVEQATLLDAARFIDRIVDERVAVVQVVPSYLDVLVSYLSEHPRTLADLRFVSTTGEPLKAELVERWFAVQPGVKLLNAYGLTETSDDTNHEILARPPSDGRVPLGRPIRNVLISVVDEQLAPVPLGAPGEIVFAGVCVGRGYINDPERTQRVFLADPGRAGGRIYRSGDFGRWRPDGKLEFLGRRDAQVKISGFRIEIGEVENRLLRIAGVRDGAVVVAERADRSKQLVAFYSGDRALEPATLREQLGASLPAYMVPAVLHRCESLPLTANGKIDKKALSALAGKSDGAPQRREEPRGATEQRLAGAWAAVLGIARAQIGRNDHFFELGGTSLSAVRMAIAMGRALSFKEIAAQPVLADQATLLDRKEARLDRNEARPAPPSATNGSCAP